MSELVLRDNAYTILKDDYPDKSIFTLKSENHVAICEMTNDGTYDLKYRVGNDKLRSYNESVAPMDIVAFLNNKGFDPHGSKMFAKLIKMKSMKRAGSPY